LRYSYYTTPSEPEPPSPFPQVESITVTTANSSDRTSHPVGIPATLEAGDLLVVFFACDGNPTLSIDEANSTADWTIASSYVSGTGVRGAVLWKIADDDVDTLTLTTSAAQISMEQTYRISNYETSDPVSVTYSVWSSGETPPTPPANTGGYGADDYLWIAAYAGDSYASRAVTGPTDFTNLTITSVDVGGGCSVNSARRELAIDGAYTPGVFVETAASVEEWVAFTVIINPIQ